MKLQPSVMSVGLGAGIMYLLDPEHGVRRRAELRERATGLRGSVGDAAHGLRERSRGVVRRAARSHDPAVPRELAGDMPSLPTGEGDLLATQRPPALGAVAGVLGGSLLLVGAGLLLRTLRQRRAGGGSTRALGKLPRLHRHGQPTVDQGVEPDGEGLLDAEHELLVHGSDGNGHDGALTRL